MYRENWPFLLFMRRYKACLSNQIGRDSALERGCCFVRDRRIVGSKTGMVGTMRILACICYHRGTRPAFGHRSAVISLPANKSIQKGAAIQRAGAVKNNNWRPRTSACQHRSGEGSRCRSRQAAVAMYENSERSIAGLHATKRIAFSLCATTTIARNGVSGAVAAKSAVRTYCGDIASPVVFRHRGGFLRNAIAQYAPHAQARSILP